MLFEFLRWWYGPGWLDAWRRSAAFIIHTERAFSTGVLLKTLFSPWKQIVALPGRSLDEKFRGMLDNLVSRTIGFFVRILALIAAGVLTVVVGVFSILIAAVWPALPAAFVYFLAKGIIG